MGKKELVGNRQYTDEFKVEAVRLGESMGGNQAAKRFGVPLFAEGGKHVLLGFQDGFAGVSQVAGGPNNMQLRLVR